MPKLNITYKEKDEIWNLLQGFIHEKYLNHWLTPEEVKNFKKENKIRNIKLLKFNEILDILENNGYNVQRINQSIGEEAIGTVRISE